MVLVHTKPNAHKGLDYNSILGSLGPRSSIGISLR
jgi:hypothetical protein